MPIKAAPESVQLKAEVKTEIDLCEQPKPVDSSAIPSHVKKESTPLDQASEDSATSREKELKTKEQRLREKNQEEVRKVKEKRELVELLRSREAEKEKRRIEKLASPFGLAANKGPLAGFKFVLHICIIFEYLHVKYNYFVWLFVCGHGENVS